MCAQTSASCSCRELFQELYKFYNDSRRPDLRGLVKQNLPVERRVAFRVKRESKMTIGMIWKMHRNATDRETCLKTFRCYCCFRSFLRFSDILKSERKFERNPYGSNSLGVRFASPYRSTHFSQFSRSSPCFDHSSFRFCTNPSFVSADRSFRTVLDPRRREPIRKADRR